MEAQAIRLLIRDKLKDGHQDLEQTATTTIEAAIARRHDKFALSDLSWTADGYTVTFRLGIVKTAVEVGVFEDSWRMDRMLDWIGLTFQSYSPLEQRQSRDLERARLEQ